MKQGTQKAAGGKESEAKSLNKAEDTNSQLKQGKSVSEATGVSPRHPQLSNEQKPENGQLDNLVKTETIVDCEG